LRRKKKKFFRGTAAGVYAVRRLQGWRCGGLCEGPPRVRLLPKPWRERKGVGGVPGCGTCRTKTGLKRWRCPRIWDMSYENGVKTLEVSLDVGHLLRKPGQNVGDVPESGTCRTKTGVKRWRCPRRWDISDENGVKTLEMSLKVGHLGRKWG